MTLNILRQAQIATLEQADANGFQLNGERLKVGILGATGMVGQNFVRMLRAHPFFEIVILAASARSAGKTYAAAVRDRWVMEFALPESIAEMRVREVSEIDALAQEIDIAFCAVDMDKDAVRRLEDAYARRGVWVTSNNSAYRGDPLVPMIIPAVNPQHLQVIEMQRAARGYTTGGIIVKSNCSIQSYVTVLEPLREFGLQSIQVHSEQAISGAGKTFATWREMERNLIPHIGGEEEKSEREPLKIWGEIGAQGIEPRNDLSIRARCVRVAVLHGHTAHVTAQFERVPPRATILERWQTYQRSSGLPSAPHCLIAYTDDPTRPQPLLDVMRENGMGVTIGHLKINEKLRTVSFTALAHNTILGAAGGAVWATEEALRRGLIYRRADIAEYADINSTARCRTGCTE